MISSRGICRQSRGVCGQRIVGKFLEVRKKYYKIINDLGGRYTKLSVDGGLQCDAVWMVWCSVDGVVQCGWCGAV